MATGFNRWNGLGNLGRDPELKFTPSGKAVLTFSMACSESYYDKSTQESKTSTEWINVTIWGRRAEALAKLLHKGSRVFVHGKIKTDSWEDKQTGAKRYRTYVSALEVVLNGSLGDTTPSRPRDTPRDASQDSQDDPYAGRDDDIPF